MRLLRLLRVVKQLKRLKAVQLLGENKHECRQLFIHQEFSDDISIVY